MTVYKITLLVSAAQEKAIIDLYRKRSWIYMKTGHEDNSSSLQLLEDQDSTPQAEHNTFLTPTPKAQCKFFSEKLCDDRIPDVRPPAQEQYSRTINMKVKNQPPESEMQSQTGIVNHCDGGILAAKQLTERNSTLTLKGENSENYGVDGSLNYKKEQVEGREISDQSYQEETDTEIIQHEGEDSNSTLSDNLDQACVAVENELVDSEIINPTPTNSLAISVSSKVKYGNNNEPVHVKEKHGDDNITVADAKPLTKRKYAEFYCKDCEHTFKLKASYERHLREDRCRHQCDICGKVFKYSGGKGHISYVRHMSYHYKQKDHECPVCGWRCILRCDMKRHLKRHTEPKPICDQCGDAFPTIPALKSHKNNMHNENKEKVACSKCPKVFTTKYNYYYHFKMKHDTEYNKTFPCSVCGKQFKNQRLLKVHGAVHKETKDFKCDLCSSSFKLLNQLNTHKKRHFQAYSCFCKICNKGFYGPSKLRAHEMVHAGTKPHQCSVCEYRCTFKDNLKKHEKIHKK